MTVESSLRHSEKITVYVESQLKKPCLLICCPKGDSKAQQQKTFFVTGVHSQNLTKQC